MPGTCASLFALCFYYIFRNNAYIYIIITCTALVIGFLASSKAIDEFKNMSSKPRDPSQIVIDEFSSQLLVFLFIPFSITNFIIGFILFRLLDIFKLPVIKKMEKLPKGFGIMLDDIAIAIFINLLLQIKKIYENNV